MQQFLHNHYDLITITPEQFTYDLKCVTHFDIILFNDTNNAE